MKGDKAGAKTLLWDQTNALLYASRPLNTRPDGADRQTVNIQNLAGSADPQVPRGDVVDRVLVTVNFFADASSLSRRLIQKYVAAGTIKSVKIGRARRIPASELDRIAREGVTEL